MSYRKVSIQELPKKLQIMTKIHQDPGIIQIFECKTKEDLFDLSSQFPFETTAVMNNANDAKTIEGYFMVGLAIPGKADQFRRPVLAYYYMNDHDWRVYSADIKKEVDRRKKLYNETKAGWKGLVQS